ncbi:MAG TPA: tRNA (guanosine(37)-N1)-methyltransferase TrmD, partial [Chromatiaceae bacterium]|nr:tRNA (guanosine(37)-N1)-methyltransferase TrmD [Chromatiaceae bacterium]
MRFDVVTLFPEMFRAMESGVTGKALRGEQAELHLWNPRDYAGDAHRTVDDRPYGGGPGMVMMVEPLRAAVQAAKKAAPKSRVIYLTPQGRRFDQKAARRMCGESGLV